MIIKYKDKNVHNDKNCDKGRIISKMHDSFQHLVHIYAFFFQQFRLCENMLAQLNSNKKKEVLKSHYPSPI